MTNYLFQLSSDDFQCHHKIDRTPQDACPMHTHDEIELYYFISGDCSYLVEGTMYHLKAHDILIMRPFEAHKLIVNSSLIPYERIVIEASPALFAQADPENALLSSMADRPLGTGNRFTVSDFGHSLCSDMFEMIAAQSGRMTRAQLLAVTLFVLCEAKCGLEKKGNEARGDDIGTRLIDYVNRNLFSEITLENISRVFFMSRSQINRVFKQNTGSSVGQYIIAKRPLTARNRIRAGEAASQAYIECGYRDYSAFYRAYTKRFGTSPQSDRTARKGPR